MRLDADTIVIEDISFRLGKQSNLALEYPLDNTTTLKAFGDMK
jgi:hypothetical protein